MRGAVEDRFAEKWIPEPNSGCWLWTGAHLPSGYGMIGKGGRGSGYHYTHRLSYQLHCGEIPSGMSVLHKCDVPACVNPDHLFIGTQKENMKDKQAKGRQLKGEGHPNSILSTDIVRNIRKKYSTGTTSLSKLGNEFGICMQHVHDIVTNKIWKIT